MEAVMKPITKHIDVENNEDGWATIAQWLPAGWARKMRESGGFVRAEYFKVLSFKLIHNPQGKRNFRAYHR